MAGTIELSEKAFQQMLKKIEEQGGGATHLQERLAELKDTNLANATANSPAVKQSNKMLAQAISESIVSGLSKTLAAAIKENNNDEKLERLITQDKEEMDTLNSSVGNLTGEVITTNSLLTDIYQLLRTQNASMQQMQQNANNNNNLGIIGGAMAAAAAAMALLGNRMNDLFKRDKTDNRGEGRDDVKSKVRDDGKSEVRDDGRSEGREGGRKNTDANRVSENRENNEKDANRVSEGNEKDANRVSEGREGGRKNLNLIEPGDSKTPSFDEFRPSAKGSWNPLNYIEELLFRGNDGAMIVRWKTGEKVLHWLGKKIMYALVLIAIAEGAKQIWELDRDEKGNRLYMMSKNDYTKAVTKIVADLCVEFGASVVLGELGGILAGAAFTATTGVGGFPAALIGSAAGFLVGGYFDYYFGGNIRDFVENVVDYLFDPPKNINNPKSKGDVLAKFMKGSKEREKDSLNEARRRAEIFNGYADFRPTDQSREFRGGGIGATDASGFTNISGGVGADTDIPAAYNKYSGTIYNDDFRNRGIGATDATGGTNISGGVGAGTSVRKETPFKTDNGGMIPIGQYKSSVNKVMSKEVYDYLKSKGLDDNHAIGMLANIQAESSFNAGAVGDNGTSGGLFQHHGSRFRAMVSAAGQDWQHNWKGQIDYALSEQDSKMFLGMNFKSPEEASAWFTSKWERPKDPSEATKRLGFVEQFKKMFTGNDATVATAPQKSGAAVNQTSSMLENNSGKNSFTDALNNNGGGGSTPPPVVGQISNPKIADAGKVNGPVGAAEHDVRDLLMSQAA